MVTTQPDNADNPFKVQETFIHFAKDSSVNPAAFSNLRTPANPNGILAQSEMFSRMVDFVSPMNFEWNPSTSLLSAYKPIAEGANTLVVENKKASAIYLSARNFLLMEKEEENVSKPAFAQGEDEKADGKVKMLVNTPAFEAYNKNMSNYVAAISNYRLAHNGYLKKLKANDEFASDEWQAIEPKLENDMKEAYRKLVAGDGKYVEQALNIMRTTINGSIRQALVSAQEAVDPSRLFASSVRGLEPWAFSYPIPDNWATATATGFTKVEFSSTEQEEHRKRTTHDIESNAKFLFWRIGAGADAKIEERESNTKTEALSMSAEIAKVEIVRPWFTESLFRLENWFVDSYKKYGISTGQINKENTGAIPMVPVAFFVAKNITIKGSFSKEDREWISSSVKSNMKVGFGPFTIAGKYKYSSDTDNFSSKVEEGKIEVGGMQIIAWVSRVIPASPKMDPPTSSEVDPSESTKK